MVQVVIRVNSLNEAIMIWKNDLTSKDIAIFIVSYLRFFINVLSRADRRNPLQHDDILLATTHVSKATHSTSRHYAES